MELKNKLLEILEEVDEYRESPLEGFADEIIQLFKNQGWEKVQVENFVIPLPANIGRLEQAKRFALMNFDKWNDVTGVVEPHCSYYYEICGCIDDAVEFGFGVAHGQNFKTIVRKIRKANNAIANLWRKNRTDLEKTKHEYL